MGRKKVIKEIKKTKIDSIFTKKCPLIQGECTQKFCRAWIEERKFCKIEKYFDKAIKNHPFPEREEL